MNMPTAKKTVLTGLVLGAVVSASTYFVNPELPASPSHDQLTRPNAILKDHSAAAATLLLKDAAHEEPRSDTRDVPVAIPPANKPERQEQNDVPLTDPAMLAKNSPIPLSAGDLALPPPSAKNVMAEATGEYADQINLPRVFHKPQPAGDAPPEVAADSHPPTGINVMSEPQGEHADEVRQQALIDTARAIGYLLPEVAPDSHPPTGKNVASEPQGEHAREVNQQALIDKGNPERFLLPEVAIEQ